MEPLAKPALSERQGDVLRAMVTAWLGEAAPIGSATVSHLLPVHISSASIRNTMAELSEMGLIEKPHASAGRLPTEQGLRVFVDELLGTVPLAAYEKRSISYSMDEVDALAVPALASQLLSDHTRLLGFVVTPRIERIELRHVSLVRLSSNQLLVVLVSRAGEAHRRVVEDRGDADQPELDRIAALLNERVSGRTLAEVRALLAQEATALRDRADRLLVRALELGSRALADEESEDDSELVVATRLALLDQPEFHDPRRVRDLFAALEDQERLLEVIDQLMERGGVRVAFGEEVDEPGLRRCALVATSYGGEEGQGALGVIGPSRMDYGRVIPLVAYLSGVLTDKLST